MADRDIPPPSSQPIGSTALVVAKDNLIVLDNIVNSTDLEILNRKGDPRKTLVGIEALVDIAIDDVEAAKTQALIDIDADVVEVDSAKDTALIDINADVAEVDSAKDVALIQIDADLATVAAEVNTINDSVASAAASETAAASSAFDANASALLAQAASGFVGKWVDQTGAANIPYSVWHDGANWQPLNNIADVTLSEPSTSNADWSIIITRALSVPNVSLPLDSGVLVEKLNGPLSFSRASATGNINTSGVSETLGVDEPAISGDK